jgi:hypothetical protein
MPHYVGHFYTVIEVTCVCQQELGRCCTDVRVAQQRVSTPTSVGIVVHRVAGVGSGFPLLRSSDPGQAGCLSRGKNETDRQTDGHERLHKVFFAHG